MASQKIRKIALEEAFNLPELIHKSKGFTSPYGDDTLGVDLIDIHDQRLKRMDENNIAFMILSLTSAGVQDETDPAEAKVLAERANDYLAAEIAKNPLRFGGFAALSMHDPKVAAAEARRAIQTLGFCGILVNDFQSTGPDGEGAVFYDQPEWDLFWKEVQDLDVPFYIHPRLTTPAVANLFLSGRPWMRASAYFFSVGVSLHVLVMYANGVFDRFPRLQVVIGHMGEHLPFQLWRIDHRLGYYPAQIHMPATRTLRETMKTNISITTSGHYGTPALRYAIEELGVDRIMFSIDYPYDKIEEAAEWFDSITEITPEQKEKIAFSNAEKLFKISVTTRK